MRAPRSSRGSFESSESAASASGRADPTGVAGASLQLEIARRGGRVDEGGRFEIYCAFCVPRVRIPPSPPLQLHSVSQPETLRRCHDRAAIVLVWRGDREAEGARLEIVCTETYRGFESLPLRHSCCRPPVSVAPGGRAAGGPRDASPGQESVVMVGSRRLRVREPRQVRKEATVSVPVGRRGARPSPPPLQAAPAPARLVRSTP